MSTTVVEPALRATYHLAGADAQRLRRLTRQSGLEAENVLSRLAIVRSITAGRRGPHSNCEPSNSGRMKEIKGAVLLGRPRQAALILALLAHSHDEEFVDPKTAITWHWARGLRLLEDTSANGDVLHSLAEELADRKPGGAPNSRRSRRSGLSDSIRDALAAAVGRRFPRWSTEVCRLVAMAARLDANEVDAVAERLAAAAGRREPGAVVSETMALHILQEQWGVNRLGLTAADRAVLSQLLLGEEVDDDDVSVPFLVALGLVVTNGAGARLSPMGLRLGEEAVHP